MNSNDDEMFPIVKAFITYTPQPITTRQLSAEPSLVMYINRLLLLCAIAQEAMKTIQPPALTLWDRYSSSPPSSSSSSSSTFINATATKRLRPLGPVQKSADTITAEFATATNMDTSLLVHPSGTRWNPMPEQVKLLEALYAGGLRTPNPVQIEEITAELSRFGRIEGKNVFYWFQNHKARERQKQKRAAAFHLKKEEMATKETTVDLGRKRKCRSWSRAEVKVVEECERRTLELFPLQPEWKQI